MENSVPSFAPQPRETPQGHGMSDANSERVFVQGRLGPSSPPSLPTAGCRRLTHLGSEHSSGKALKDLLRSRHLDACTLARTHTQNMRAHPEHVCAHTCRTHAEHTRAHPEHTRAHTQNTHAHMHAHTCRTHRTHVHTRRTHRERIHAQMHACRTRVRAHAHTRRTHTPGVFVRCNSSNVFLERERSLCLFFSN